MNTDTHQQGPETSFSFAHQFEMLVDLQEMGVQSMHNLLPGGGRINAYSRHSQPDGNGYFCHVTYTYQDSKEVVQYTSGVRGVEVDEIWTSSRSMHYNPRAGQPFQHLYLQITLDLRNNHMEWAHHPSYIDGIHNASQYMWLRQLDQLFTRSISEASWEIRHILAETAQSTSQQLEYTRPVASRSGSGQWYRCHSEPIDQEYYED